MASFLCINSGDVRAYHAVAASLPRLWLQPVVTRLWLHELFYQLGLDLTMYFRLAIWKVALCKKLSFHVQIDISKDR